MYRLLIVDDEAGHRAGLVGLLRILKPEYLVFEAENGSVALQMMEVMEFDLVLTDIRMPQVDGLSLLESAKRKHPYTRIAILSAYGLFDYAKRSVTLGADDYLLKPVDAEELRQCLDRMENRLEKGQDSTRNGGLVDEQMYLFLTGELPKSEQEATRALFGEFDSGMVACIQPDGAWLDEERRSLFQYELRRCLKAFGSAVVFRPPMDPGTLIGVIACKGVAFVTLIGAMEQKAAELRGESGQAVTIGVCGCSVNFFGRLEDAYSRARVACMQRFFDPERTLFAIGPEQAIDPFSPLQLGVSIKELDASLCAGNALQAFSLIKDRLSPLCTPGTYPSKIKEVIMYTFIFLLGSLTYPLGKEEKDEILSAIGRTMLECASMRDMQLEIMRALEKIASVIEANRKNQREEVFDEVLGYLGGHFAQQLSLSGVAERFHYNPSYFSALFKQQVGLSFSEYLTEIRMKEAARLLAESNLYAAKIGEKVGYPSATYFTKAFKKQYGMSPDQYRKRGR